MTWYLSWTYWCRIAIQRRSSACSAVSPFRRGNVRHTFCTAVAAQLNVAHVLEGSVRKMGNRVRITAQLIDARSDSHLWSATYDRELNDIFAVQDEIAAAISDALKVKLALVEGERVQPTTIKAANTDAYDAYLRGRELVRRRGKENLVEAVRHLERSLRLDENFAPAHAEVAIATLLVHGYGESTPLQEVLRIARLHLDRAQQLEPDLAEAHAGRALLAYLAGEPKSQIRYARKALASNPSDVNAMNWLQMALTTLGRYEEALPGLQKGFGQSSDVGLRRLTGLQLQRSYTGLAQDDQAVEVALRLTRLYPDDPEILYHTGRLISNYAYLLTMKLAEVAPTSVWTHQAAGEANESLGNYDAALDDYRKVLVLDPDRPGIHYRLGRVFLARARPPLAESDAEAQAAEEFEQELRIDPTNANAAYELGELLRKAGDLDRAGELFALAVEHYPEFEQGLVGLGRVLIAQGSPGPALPHLEKAAALDPEDDVAYFHLWQAHRALGNAEEEKRALAEFQRLRNQKREEERRALLRQHVVTQQELEDEMAPP